MVIVAPMVKCAAECAAVRARAGEASVAQVGGATAGVGDRAMGRSGISCTVVAAGFAAPVGSGCLGESEPLGLRSGGVAGTSGAGGSAGSCSGAPNGSCPCIRVAPDGDDLVAETTLGATPFRSVDAAIAFADGHRDIAMDVCVASVDCATLTSYPGPRGVDFAMRDGISVYGSYEASAFTRCTDTTTELLPATAAGFLFGPSSSSHDAQLALSATRTCDTRASAWPARSGRLDQKPR